MRSPLPTVECRRIVEYPRRELADSTLGDMETARPVPRAMSTVELELGDEYPRDDLQVSRGCSGLSLIHI